MWLSVPILWPMFCENELHYVGSELELFALARNYKSYIAAMLYPYLGPRVLEVGAGVWAFCVIGELRVTSFVDADSSANPYLGSFYGSTNLYCFGRSIVAVWQRHALGAAI